MKQGNATPTPGREAHAAYLDARSRALGHTTTGLRFTAWRLGRRRGRLSVVQLARLRAVTGELGARGKVLA